MILDYPIMSQMKRWHSKLIFSQTKVGNVKIRLVSFIDETRDQVSYLC